MGVKHTLVSLVGKLMNMRSDDNLTFLLVVVEVEAELGNIFSL